MAKWSRRICEQTFSGSFFCWRARLSRKARIILAAASDAASASASAVRPINVRWTRAGLDDFSFKDAWAVTTIAIRLASRRLLTHLEIDELLNKESQSQSRPSVVAAVDASSKLKSSNPARAHLTLIGRTADTEADAASEAAASMIRT